MTLYRLVDDDSPIPNYEPVEPTDRIRWCFKHEERSEGANRCEFGWMTSSSCDVVDAGVVRIGDTDE